MLNNTDPATVIVDLCNFVAPTLTVETIVYRWTLIMAVTGNHQSRTKQITRRQARGNWTTVSTIVLVVDAAPLCRMTMVFVQFVCPSSVCDFPCCRYRKTEQCRRDPSSPLPRQRIRRQTGPTRRLIVYSTPLTFDWSRIQPTPERTRNKYAVLHRWKKIFPRFNCAPVCVAWLLACR